MSEVYRGGKVPKSLDRATRRLLEDHDRMLVRGLPVGDTTVIVQGKSDVRIPASPVRYVKTTLSGNVVNIPIERAGQVLVMAFAGGPTLKATGGNLHLSGDFTPETIDETITIISDGVYWREMGRSGLGGGTFIPVTRWGAHPGTGVDVTTKLQEALDEVPTGRTLYFPPGAYTISAQLTLDRSDIGLWFSPGAVLSCSTAFTDDALIAVQGTASATEEALTANGEEGAVSVEVASVASFPAGTWIAVRDARAGIGSALWPYFEINKVFASSGTTVSLAWPLRQQYTTANTAKIVAITPVENVTVQGGGTLGPCGTTAAGGDCLRFDYAVNCTVKDLELTGMHWYGVGVVRSQSIVVSGCDFHEPLLLASGTSGRGYGAVTHSSWNVVINDNTFRKLRHGIDFSYMSGNCVADGNALNGSGIGGINTHTNVKRCVISNNTIDGNYGVERAAGISDGYDIVITYDHLTDTLNATAHGLANDTGVILCTTGTLPAGLSTSTQYYVVNQTANTFQISTSVGGAPVLFADNGSGIHSVAGVLASGINIDQGNEDMLITSNVVRNTRLSGITVDSASCKNILISSNIISEFNQANNSSHAGIRVQEQSAGGVSIPGIIVRGNHIHDGKRTGILAGLNEAIVEANTIYSITSGDADPVGVGISLKPSNTANPVYRMEVRGNHIWNCSKDGVRVADTADSVARVINCTIADNWIYDCDERGIYYRRDASGCYLLGNVVQDCGTETNNTYAAFDIDGDGAVLKDNVALETRGSNPRLAYGIDVGATADGTVLFGNYVAGNFQTNDQYVDAGATGTKFPLVYDDANDRVGMGTAAPAYKLDVVGDVRATTDAHVNDQLFVGVPTDTSPVRYSSLYDGGSTRAGAGKVSERTEAVTDYDGTSGSATLQGKYVLIDLSGSGVLGGPSALTAIGHSVYVPEDASGGAVDGHTRIAYRATFNHTDATSGDRTAFDSEGGKIRAKPSSVGSAVWEVDPVPTGSCVTNYNTEAWTSANVTPSTGTMTRPASSVARINPGAGVTIRGISGGTIGAWLWVINISANNVTINNQDGAATATDRIITSDGSNLTLTPDGVLLFWYDTTTGRWREMTRLL